MRYVSSSEMREIDRRTIEDYKIPGIVLMENAVLKILGHIPKDKDRYTVVVGTGNNGGDGIGVARHLYIGGKSVDIILMGQEEKLKGDALTNYNIVKQLSKSRKVDVKSLEIFEYDKLLGEEREKIVNRGEVIVDAIFGTGISSEVKGKYRTIIEEINNSRSYKISIDIPSGVSGDTGEIMGVAIRADKTVTLQYPKLGFKNEVAKNYMGELVIETIGIPYWI